MEERLPVSRSCKSEAVTISPCYWALRLEDSGIGPGMVVLTGLYDRYLLQNCIRTVAAIFRGSSMRLAHDFDYYF
jgi:hypothetical protein